MSYGIEDHEYVGRRRSPRTSHNQLRRSAHYLDAKPGYSVGGRHRSGSGDYARTQSVNFYTDQVLDMAPRDHMRSRSRRRSEEPGFLARPDLYEWRLAQKGKEIEDFRRKQLWEKESELQKMKERVKEMAVAEEAEKEKKLVILEYEEDKRLDAERAKAEEVRIKEKLERDQRETCEKEEREWAQFLRKQKEIEEKENAEKKEAEERFAAEMRRRLARFCYTEKQIDVLVDGDRAKESDQGQATSPRGMSPMGALAAWKLRAPVYAKVHRDYLSVRTLVYYNIPYEYDKSDPNYVIILRKLDQYTIQVLFEHTKQLRSGKMLLQVPQDKLQHAWFRKRDRSSSRVRRIGIVECRK